MEKKYHAILKKQHFIDGEWVDGESEEKVKVSDKYTQEILAEISLADEAQMEKAIQASLHGFEKIKSWSAEKKATHLQHLRDALKENQETWVQLIVAEAGKPIDYARIEVARAISTLDTGIREVYNFSGEVIPMDFGAGTGKTAMTKRFPIGPVACITPFNFPLNLVLHKIVPALAVGCSFILKPAPQAPLTSLALAALLEEAGYPKGVVNVLLCTIPAAEKMIKDDRIRILSFTGSARVGWHLKTLAGKKKVTLELGGNAAVIVDETANLEETAAMVAKGAYLYAGQICISTQRIIVLKEIYNKFCNLLIEQIKQLPKGNPLEEGCVVGPLIDHKNLERVNAWVAEALEQGASILLGGSTLSKPHNMYMPTLLAHVNSTMKVVCEEVFAPLAVVIKTTTFEEALEKANESVYGLQAGVITNRLDRVKLAFERLEAGGVIMNHVPGFRVETMPYGGIKNSGLGREGVKYAMKEMTEIKLLVY